jgi:hypothetical protein
MTEFTDQEKEGETGQPLGDFLLLYPIGYNQTMRPVRFLGDSLKCLRDFPEDARHDAGVSVGQGTARRATR